MTILFFTILVVIVLSVAGLLIAYQISRHEKETTRSLADYFDGLKSFFMVTIVDRFFTAAEDSVDDSDDLHEL